MGVFGGKKGPKPEEAYGAVKTSNIATLKGLLEKNCDPTAYKDAMVRGPACVCRSPRLHARRAPPAELHGVGL